MSWFDKMFNRPASNPAPLAEHTDFQDNYPGKTGSGGVPGSTTTAPPSPPIPRSARRNFQAQGDSGDPVETGTINFQQAWEKGGPGNQWYSPVSQQGYRERAYDPNVVVGNLNQTWVPSRTDTPIGHADQWTPQATGAYLPKEGTGHPLDPAGPGFNRPVPGLPRVSEGRRKIYLSGEVQDFGAYAVIDLLGIPAMTGTGRTRIRPQTWWEEPAPYFANYYLSSASTGTPASPGREESPAQAQVAGTTSSSRREAFRGRRSHG